MSTVTENEGLVRAVLADPWDELSRNVYADWLEEQGEALLAELARRPPAPSRRLDKTPVGDALLSGCPPVQMALFHQGGFPSVRIGMAAFRTKACQTGVPGWMKANRITGLELDGQTKDWAKAANSPVLAGVRLLDLSSCQLWPVGTKAFTSSPHLAGVWSLDLRQSLLYREGLRSLAHCEALSGLARLHLKEGGQLTRETALELGEAPFAGWLQYLELLYSGLDDDGAQALLSPRLAPSLVTLSLRGCVVGNATATILAESPSLASLRNLDLSYTSITEAGLEALARSPLLPRLRRLCLGGSLRATAEGRYLAFARALADIPGPTLVLDYREPDARNPALRAALGERLVLRD
jgi:uncharacterized protein (TIGR02996 family)